MYNNFLLLDLDKLAHSSFMTSYCTCKNGARTLRTCAHCVAIIWYFAFDRNRNLNDPSTFLDEHFLHLKPISDETDDEADDNAVGEADDETNFD